MCFFAVILNRKHVFIDRIDDFSQDTKVYYSDSPGSYFSQKFIIYKI